MVADLVLTVVQAPRDDLAANAGLAVTDGLVVATGGAVSDKGLVPWSLAGLRDVLLAGDALWACGDGGKLAVSRDRGASWAVRDTGTQACLTGLAAASDGSVWVVGDGGFAARVSERVERIELGTNARLAAVYAVKDEVVALAGDGTLRRWRRAEVTAVQTGAPHGVSAMLVTKQSWIVIGAGGFVARSPDGAWFSRVKTDLAIDLQAIASLPDGRVIAVGDRQIVVSGDDGRTWRPLAADVRAPLRSVARVGHGAVIGGDHGLIVRLTPSAVPEAATTIPMPVIDLPVDRPGDRPIDRPSVAPFGSAARPSEAIELPANTEPVAPTEQQLADALAHTPRDRWADVAWKWLGDGAGHRALLRKLDGDPELAAQIAALDELRELDAGARAIAVPRIAAELAPELEAILAGSVVRGDDLAGVLDKPDDDDDRAPGWDAIDRALAPIYGGKEPTAHFGTALPYMLGGNDPIHGISAYARTDPPHWHIVTYGFTDLFVKETDDPDESGFGFELTLRLARAPGDDTVPMWALNFLQNLARYVFGSGNRFAAGHKMGLNGPIALGHDTQITAICFADDPELGDFESELGKARFVQIVGITDDEYRLIQEWSTTRLIDMLRRESPMLVTDLARASLLANAGTAAEVHRFVEAEGSSEDLAFAGDMALATDGGGLRVTLGALYAAALPRAMRGRLRHGRTYELRGRNASLMLAPGTASSIVSAEEGGVSLELAPELVTEVERQLRAGLAGEYGFDAWPKLVIEVVPSFIRDQAGQAIEVKGVADPVKAADMIAAENARLAAGDDDDDDDDSNDDDDEDDDDDDDEPIDPDRVKAALAMTERALGLAPDDDDTQFTHAMLMLDADRSGLPDKIDGLLALLPTFEAGVRINVATRMGKSKHACFSEAVDVALGEALPERIVAERSSANLASFGDVADELFAELGEAILELSPDRMPRLVALLPDDIELLGQLAYASIQAKQIDSARALYDRLLAMPIPDDGDARMSYLRALNNACIQAHAAKAYAAAVRIADRAQPVAHENPYIYHSAACAYAATGDLAKAFEQVQLAVKHDYEHLAKVEVDSDLGELLEWPQFKALFRDWRARKEGN